MSILRESLNNIIKLPRYGKIITVIFIDISLCFLSTWFAFYLRLEEFIKIDDLAILALLISIILAIPVFWLLGLYSAMFRFVGPTLASTVAIAILIYGLLYFAVITIYGIQGIWK